MATSSTDRSRRGAEPAPVPATPGLLRSMNDRVVLDLLLEHGTLSRGDVRRFTGVSKPTASQSLTRLEESGHVLQTGVEESGRGGRAAAVYQLNPRAGFAAAIDVTPTGSHAQIADLLGTIIGEQRSTASADPDDAARTLHEALDAAGLSSADLSSLVVALPGSYDPDADVLRFAAALPRWQQPGLLERLEQAAGVATYIENDVNLVAMAEQRRGAGRGEDDFFLLWSDEGVGAALMLDGRLRRGSTGGAGEIAYLLVPGVPVIQQPVREDHGGFDDLAGSASIVELAAAHGIIASTAPEAVAAAVRSSGPVFLDELGARFAIAIASVISLIDPATVVLAGSVMQAGGDTLLDSIRAHVDDTAIRRPRLKLAEVVDEPVVAGALLMSLDNTRDGVFST